MEIRQLGGQMPFAKKENVFDGKRGLFSLLVCLAFPSYI